MVAIKLESRGACFYRCSRVGRNGVTFAMLKFRKMHDDASGPALASWDDERFTRIGAFLAQTKLDEIPQLWNVLRGQMSLVGPRPPLPHEAARYGSDMRRRLRVRPGMTGLWQVSGRSDLSWDETVRLDLFYVDNWSMVQDLNILMRTVSAVLGSRGAY
jgi:lipopolysaccharide/colanic/teichoic acid biosynthesis glycosyltransferase